MEYPSTTLFTSWTPCQCHKRFCWAWTSSLNMGSALMHQTTLYASQHLRASVGQPSTSGDGKHHTTSISITLCLAGFSKQLEHHTHFWLHLPRQRTARRLHSLAWCVRVTACWRSGMANQRFGQTYHRQQQHTVGLG